MDSISSSYFDIVDIIVIAIITIVGGYLFFKYRFDPNEKRSLQGNLGFSNDCLGPAQSSIQNIDTSFLSRMKSENRQVLN